MAKFKFGDIIKANKESNERYGVTTQKNGWTGKVTSVKKNGDISVKTLTPEEYEGRVFAVDERYFALVDGIQIKKHIMNKNTVIVILRDGRKGIAKCNPADKFNLAFGTALAVARAYGDKETEAKLLGEPVEPVKEETKFKVGELVRIRQWDDMEKEFGINSEGTILTLHGFVVNMTPLCGKYAEIVGLEENDKVGLKFFNCEGLEYLTEFYSFDTDMIERV